MPLPISFETLAIILFGTLAAIATERTWPRWRCHWCNRLNWPWREGCCWCALTRKIQT